MKRKVYDIYVMWCMTLDSWHVCVNNVWTCGVKSLHQLMHWIQSIDKKSKDRGKWATIATMRFIKHKCSICSICSVLLHLQHATFVAFVACSTCSTSNMLANMFLPTLGSKGSIKQRMTPEWRSRSAVGWFSEDQRIFQCEELDDDESRHLSILFPSGFMIKTFSKHWHRILTSQYTKHRKKLLYLKYVL